MFGAQLAAMLGLPYAFASHFAPAEMMGAIAVYRDTFRPSARCARPYVMLGINVVAAETDARGELLASSMHQAFVALRTGNPGKLQPPVAGYFNALPSGARAMLDGMLSASAIGSARTIKARVEAFIERTGADELMIASQIFDFDARVRSLEILSEAFADSAAALAA